MALNGVRLGITSVLGITSIRLLSRYRPPPGRADAVRPWWACGRRRQSRKSRGPRAGIALRRRSSRFRSALGMLRRACGLNVASWGWYMS